MKRNKHSWLLLFLIISGLLSSQSVFLEGNVLSETQQPIVNANVLAIPNDKTVKMQFTSTDERGFYRLSLEQNKEYKLTFSHISYINVNQSFKTADSKSTLNITLQESLNELEEIVITQQAPITVKKDTTTYRASAFSNGKERKLRELLKKLPGIEVDKDGGVTIKGKKVTQLLVDGKQFFNGDTKLGVNNIPAEVASEIEVIEDYHETSFLKGLEDSEEIAMNIKLREDKKQFTFGDIEAGAGIENRHKLHPKIFKYAPKLTLNFIGDLNNTFDKSFTLRDYINFEGGFNFDEPNNDLFNSSIANLLRNNDYINNNHKFGGFNSQYNPNEKNQFKVYAIVLNDNSDFANTNTINYFNNNIDEVRSLKENTDTNLFLGKASYKNTPNDNTVFEADFTAEKTKADATTVNNSSFFNDNLPFTENTNSDVLKLKGSLNLDKKHNKNHVSVFNGKFSINSDDNNTLFNSATNVFSDEITIEDDTVFNIRQNQNTATNSISVFANHYWIIDRKNHFYVKAGNNFTQSKFRSLDFQELTSNQINNFDDFSNDLNSKYNRFYSQVNYKRIIGNMIAEFKLRYENQNLNNQQNSSETIISNNNLIPELKLNWDINSKNELVLNYRQRFNYNDFSSYATGRIIRGFRGVFEGTDNLDQVKTQNLSLTYSYRKSYGLSIYSSLSYRKNTDIIINNFQLFDIFNLITPLQLNRDNDFYNSRIRLSYNKPYWALKYGLRYSDVRLNNIFNSELLRSKQRNFSNSLDFSTKFEKNPNIDLGIDYNLGFNKNENLENTQKRFTITSNFSYDYQDWKFNVGYEYTNFRNEASFSSNVSFDDLNASIFYNKEDSLWSFEIKAHNITNNKSNVFNNFNQIFVNESETFVFPRYLLFSVNYKL